MTTKAAISMAMRSLALGPLESLGCAVAAEDAVAEQFLSSDQYLEELIGLARCNPSVLVELLSRSDLAGATPQTLPALTIALVERAKVAIAAIAKEGTGAEVDGEGLASLEAIVRLTGRPSLLIKNGDFDGNLLGKEWHGLTVPAARESVKAAIRSVGRITIHHPATDREVGVGTGWVCGQGLIMTNRHVADLIREPIRDQWKLVKERVQIDFISENGTLDRSLFLAKRFAHVDLNVDLAVIEVEAKNAMGEALPDPLEFAPKAADLEGTGKEQVCAIGYPGIDDGQDAPALREYFRGIFKCKRIAPGVVMRIEPAKKTLDHDCTTLKGSSGSCVLRLGTRSVVGLHFQGESEQQNTAVLMTAMRTDERLKKLGINFKD